MSRKEIVASTFLLLSIFFLGVAHIASLPPWEGFDETAHYSYIKQLADTGKQPRFGAAAVAAEVDEYITRGPMPYGHNTISGAHGAKTYHVFFSKSEQALDEFKSYLFGRPAQVPQFAPGRTANWQAQHPPLYFALMAIVSKSSDGLSLGARLLLLRLTSYALAFAGLCIAFHANRFALIHLFPRQSLALIAVSAWPLLLPMWFADMARMGNDSICVLLVSVAWLLILKIEFDSADLKRHALLGAVLGIGCWAKAFFVPISIGIGVYMIWRARWAKDNENTSGQATNWASGVAAFAAPLIVIALPLYVGNLLDSGSFFNTTDVLILDQREGWELGLNKNWSLALFVQSLGTIAKSFVWSGTWSFGRPTLGFLLPTSALVAIVVLAYFAWVIRERMYLALLPLFLIVPMLIGLFYHILVWIAAYGEKGGTPGWYLFILAGPIGLIAGLGVSRLCEVRLWRIILNLLTITGVLFTAGVSYLQILLYSGCAIKIGAESSLTVPADSECWLEPATLISRLDVVAYPLLSIVAAAIGVGLAVSGAIYGRRRTDSPNSSV